MKLFHHLIFILLVGACSAPADQPPTSIADGESGQIPTGAIIEEFTDSPGLAKISLKDGSGNLSASGVSLHQQREGSWVEYHPNGMVKSITTFVGGKKEGSFIEINANGQVTRRFNFHNDQRDGEYREYNYSAIKEERFYKNGKLEGAVRIFYPGGKIMEEGLYKNGLRDGISKWYDQEGNLTIEYEYKNGELVKK